MFQRKPPERELAAMGLTLEDYGDEFKEVEIWPDNVAAVNTFTTIATQWRMGAHGPIGLDYSQLERGFRHARVPRRERRSVFDDLRVIEDEALRIMRSYDQ